jgi:hypothetical protein
VCNHTFLRLDAFSRAIVESISGLILPPTDPKGEVHWNFTPSARGEQKSTNVQISREPSSKRF